MNFSTKALAKIVLKQFDKLIDDLYPEEDTPDALAQERMAHEAYAKNKLFACIDRPMHLAALNAFAMAHTGNADVPASDAKGHGLVVTGESGGGKTALLAAWARDWAKNHSEYFLFQHYFGATPDSASPEGFLRRLLGELKSRFGITDDIPATIFSKKRPFDLAVIPVLVRLLDPVTGQSVSGKSIAPGQRIRIEATVSLSPSNSKLVSIEFTGRVFLDSACLAGPAGPQRIETRSPHEYVLIFDVTIPDSTALTGGEPEKTFYVLVTAQGVLEETAKIGSGSINRQFTRKLPLSVPQPGCS